MFHCEMVNRSEKRKSGKIAQNCVFRKYLNIIRQHAYSDLGQGRNVFKLRPF